jgi:hypothetical protein
MKAKIILFFISLSLLVPGCLVISIHPFYTEKDVIYKPELTGKWMDNDSTSWIIAQHMQFAGLFKPDIPGQAYDITATDNKGTSLFIAHLFQLGNDMYLDFYPKNSKKDNSLEDLHLVPSHSLARVEIKDGRIFIGWYNQEWLLGLFNHNKIRLAHERTPYDIDDKNPDHEQVLLTASTEELQKFILKYGNDPDAFKKKSQDPLSQDDYTLILSRQ